MYPNKYFLHFSYDFWFIVLPLLIVFAYYKYCLRKNKKDKSDELSDRLPNSKIYLDLTEEEKFMLETLTKQSDSINSDKFLRQAIKSILEEYI